MVTPEQAVQSPESVITTLLRQMREVDAAECAVADVCNATQLLYDQQLKGANSRIGALLAEAQAEQGSRVKTNYVFILAPHDYMALEMLGQPVSVTVAKMKNIEVEQHAQIFQYISSSEALIIGKKDEDTRIRYTPFEAMPADKTIGHAFAQRRMQSPVFQMIEESSDRPIDSDDIMNHDVTIGYIAPEKDIHGLLQLLVDIKAVNVLHVQKIYEKLCDGTDTMEAVRTYLQYGPNEITEVENGWLFSRGDSLGTWVHVDTDAGEIGVGFAPDAIEQYYMEGKHYDEEFKQPFVDTLCGKELVRALEEQGLMFHPRVMENIALPLNVNARDEAGASLSVYAKLSRTVAKWVSKPETFQIERMFTALDLASVREMAKAKEAPEEYGKDISAEEVVAIRQKIANIAPEQYSEPTEALLSLVQGCIRRAERDETMPVSKRGLRTDDTISTTDNYGCAEATMNFLVDAPHSRIIEDNGVLLLHKQTEGEQTYLLSESTLFNGVEVPKGALFEYHPKEKAWMMLRLTPFTFDNPSDRAVFGGEMQKTQDYKHLVSRLGGFSLADLYGYIAANNPDHYRAT